MGGVVKEFKALSLRTVIFIDRTPSWHHLRTALWGLTITFIDRVPYFSYLTKTQLSVQLNQPSVLYFKL